MRICCDGGKVVSRAASQTAALGSVLQVRNGVLVAPNKMTNMLRIALIFITAFFVALRQLSHLFLDFLAKLFEEAGLQPVTNDYVLRETVNKKEGLCVPRVFLQSKFTKPSQSQSL